MNKVFGFLFLAVGAMSSVSMADIKSVTCTQPGKDIVVAKLTQANDGFYIYEVSMSLKGNLDYRQSLTITGTEDGIMRFEVSKNADADSFYLNINTNEGLVSLVEYESIPFEFDVICKIENN